MGELIRKIAKVHLAGNDFDIEVNKSPRGEKLRDIHIQNERIRIEIPESEFLQMASCLILAKKQFCILKGLKDE